MRFIRQEKIITNVCNVELKEDTEISLILKALKNKKIYFSLVLMKVFPSDYSRRTINYEKVRVISVDEKKKTASFHIFKSSTIIKLNDIIFDEIYEIFALTEKIQVSNKNKNIFDFIDIEEG